MAKSGRKVKKSYKLIIFYSLYIIFALFMSYVCINNFFKVKNINIKNGYLKSEYKALGKEYKVRNMINSETADEIKDIVNIDTVTKETKANVFKLAQTAEKRIKEGKTNYKIAYITFDDGPYYLTNKVLDTLKSKKVKATFFLIGRGKEKCYDNAGFDCTTMYAKEAAAGHTLANHTYSHALSFSPYLYGSTSEFINQVKKQEQLLLDKTGVKTNIVRFPGGSGSAGRLRTDMINNLKANGYGWVDWTAQDGDGGYVPSRDAAWNTFTSSINENIEVILFHDYADVTYSILSDAIDYLERNNYILLPLFYESVMVNK